MAHKKDDITIFTPSSVAVEQIQKRFRQKTLTTQNIPDSDIEVLYFAGGGVLHDLWIEANFPEQLIKKINCPIILFAVGIPHGEGFTLISHRINYFIDKISFFSFRDHVSQKIFSNLWDKPSYIIPDLGFLTKKLDAKPTGQILLQKKQRISGNYSKLTPKNYKQIMELQFQLLHEKYNSSFLEWNNFDKVIKEISESKWIVASSLHCGIISFTQQIPFSILAYQGKVTDVLSSIANKNRIIYPDEVHKTERFIPPLPFSELEKENLANLQTYLTRSLSLIHRAAENSKIEDLKLEDPPLRFKQEKKIHQYGRVYGKLHRRIYNRLKKFF